MSRSESPHCVDHRLPAANSRPRKSDEPAAVLATRSAEPRDRTQLQHLTIASTFPEFRHKRFSPASGDTEGAATRMLSQHRRHMVSYKQVPSFAYEYE